MHTACRPRRIQQLLAHHVLQDWRRWKKLTNPIQVSPLLTLFSRYPPHIPHRSNSTQRRNKGKCSGIIYIAVNFANRSSPQCLCIIVFPHSYKGFNAWHRPSSCRTAGGIVFFFSHFEFLMNLHRHCVTRDRSNVG